ncbi:MucR family transcriptional regulator [Methylobacterium radiodurans]|uniref:MucR family transcriptional regulator n=1 Tax=Methylobacterium radiodurans TaxID=2202828 RepID=A0A2U8VMT2_9HYPH|nr:MucR family transcriptional regulator [Methylobacterium radiodurans]AWN34850.1 MucR family transcriptional regulator [Methylobacterium radiodurans]
MSTGSGAGPDYVGLTTEIVSAFISRNAVSPAELSDLIGAVHTTLNRLGRAPEAEAASARVPAVPVGRSIRPEYLICLEDGKKFKSLKRHLRARHDLTPEQYRERWNLSPDYPMVAPNYAAARSDLARAMGLGQKRRKGLGDAGAA